MRRLFLTVFMLAASTAAAQQIDLKSLAPLAEKASETVEINMDEAMLKSAGGVLSGASQIEAAAKAASAGLKGIFGMVLEFDDGEDSYSRKDLDAIRSQLKTPQWTAITRIVSREDGEEVEVWMHRTPTGEIDGMLIIVAEPDELLVMNLVGAVNAADLAKIGGQFGIPIIGGAGQQ